MSKLVQELHATYGERRKPVWSTTLPVKVDVVPKIEINNGYRDLYHIGVKIWCEIWLLPRESRNGAALIEAKKSAARAITEQIFGEFRDYFFALEIAAIDQDFEKVRELVHAFQKQMFECEDGQ